MQQFLLLLKDERAGAWAAGLSPEQMQAIMMRYGTWSKALKEKTTIVNSNKLTDEGGKLIRRTSGGVTVTDGPYAEGKEIIGGYYLIEAENYDKAVEFASDCPHLDFGTIEVRAIHKL